VHVRRFLAAIVSPLVFRLPGHDARKLHRFALAEQGSHLDMRLAAARTDSPGRRVAYLKHALDEARHAQMFTRASAELRQRRGRAPFAREPADGGDLYERLGEVHFLAFVHRGERRGRQQFEAYRDYFGRRGDNKLRAMFEAILEDERVHEEYSRALLLELAGSEAAARRALRWVAAWEAWRTFRRAGKTMAEAIYFVAMVVLYATLWPLALFIRIVRPARRGALRASAVD
jgi:hypothetical protein